MGSYWTIFYSMVRASLLMFFATLASGAVLYYTFGYDNKIAFYMFIIVNVMFNVYVMRSLDDKIYPLLYKLVFRGNP